MWWNDEDILPVRIIRFLLYLIIVIGVMAGGYLTYKYLKYLNATVEVYISVFAVLLTIVGGSFSVVNRLISRVLSTDMSISVNTRVNGNDVIITCTVENKGTTCIKNIGLFAFIDQPVLNEKTRAYEYNDVLCHKYDDKKGKLRPFCALSEQCIKNYKQEYPHELKEKPYDNKFYGYKKMDFLSNNSVMYMNPGERFSEDFTFNLKEGVYRVIVVGRVNKGYKKCMCANKQFIISK